MNTQEAIRKRFFELCDMKQITPNKLSYLSGVSQSTIKSILNGESKNPGIVTIKKTCEGFGITLTEFFSAEYFKSLEQEMD